MDWPELDRQHRPDPVLTQIGFPEVIYVAKVKPEVDVGEPARFGIGESKQPLVQKLSAHCPAEYQVRVMNDGQYKDILGRTSQAAYERAFGVKLVRNEAGEMVEDKPVVIPGDLEDSIYEISVVNFDEI